MRRYNIFGCTLRTHFDVERERNQHNFTIVGFRKPRSFAAIYEEHIQYSRAVGSLTRINISERSKDGTASGSCICDSILAGCVTAPRAMKIDLSRCWADSPRDMKGLAVDEQLPSVDISGHREAESRLSRQFFLSF